MALIGGTKRGKYTKDKVQQMRTARILSKPKKKDISQNFWDMKLGKLQAAGHLKLGGFSKFETTIEKSTDMLFKDSLILKKHSVQFTTVLQDGTYGDAPHLTGYLESASNADKKPYRIKGWFNEDGTIRLELVE
jgi:hypothetical protein